MNDNDNQELETIQAPRRRGPLLIAIVLLALGLLVVMRIQDNLSYLLGLCAEGNPR